MSFATDSCWDCPISATSLVLAIAITTVVLCLSVFLCTRKRNAFRVFGAVLLAPTALWLVSAARVLPRWGVTWHLARDRQLWVIHPVLDRAVIYGWVLVSILGATVMWRRLAKRA